MKFWKNHKKLHIWLGADLAMLGLYLTLRHDRELMNGFADHITTPLKGALGRLCALTSLSVMELLYVLAGAAALVYVVWSVIAVVKARGRRGQRAYGAVLLAADVCLTVYALFCLMWGVNYWTDSFQDRSGITAQPVAAEDLEAVTAYFAQQLADTADSVPRDENGVYAVPKEQILAESTAVYGGVTELFPFLDFRDTGVKAVGCSRFMSIMGFTGVYFACIGESNVNVDSPACLLPSTVALSWPTSGALPGSRSATSWGCWPLSPVDCRIMCIPAGCWGSSTWATPCMKRTRRPIGPSGTPCRRRSARICGTTTPIGITSGTTWWKRCPTRCMTPP